MGKTDFAGDPWYVIKTVVTEYDLACWAVSLSF